MIYSTKPTRLLVGAHPVKTLTKESVPPLSEWSRALLFVIHSTCRNFVVHLASVAVVGSAMSGQVKLLRQQVVWHLVLGILFVSMFSIRYLICINV
jgi:hypothetical protein